MKKLATLEMWARRLADRELIVARPKGMSVEQAQGRDRRIILALVEAYSAGYHDSIKDQLGTEQTPKRRTGGTGKVKLVP